MSEKNMPYVPPPCPDCGGKRVMSECGPRMHIRITLFSSTSLQALVCVDCGYTKLYAKEPYKLRSKLFKQ